MVALQYTCSVLPGRRRLLFLCGLLLLSSLPALSQAQHITLDGSLGPRSTLPGPHYVIPAARGQTRGPNLFHSFGQFSLLQGESATFTGPNNIHNIIGRVTGGNLSFIDGLLRSQIPGAHLFLLNPNGVMFGPNATLDVSGSFHVSTADYLRLADGAMFSAHLGAQSTLTVAPPAAFGFLSSTPAGIAMSGSSLQMLAGKTLSAVGGDITIVGGSLASPQAPSLSAPSGRINLVSVASSGEVGLPTSDQAESMDIGTFERLGEVTIAQGALLDTSGNGGGTSVIRGGRLLVDNGTIAANNTGNTDSPGLGIDVQVRGDVRLTGEAIIISTNGSFSQGRGGSIAVRAGNITVEGGATIFTGGDVFSQGRGGDIAVMAPAGAISLNAGGRSESGGIVTGSLPFSSSDLGEIRVQAGTLKLTNGAFISSLGLGTGKGGNVIISAQESVAISGRNRQDVSSSIASFAAGEPGSISLASPIITIDSGIVGAASLLPGQRAGNITVKADKFTLGNSAQINSATLTGSKGGDITIEVGHLTLTGGSQIDSSSFGEGQGGKLR